MSSFKIVNDPIYGLIRFDDPLLIRIIDHPVLQRLRRIAQMGLASFVYPGATHTRFLHALGACHLMQKSIEQLRNKNISITPDEALSAQIAILLHDVGHGPFSHALEHKLIDAHHETLSLAYFDYLQRDLKNKNINTAKEIFSGTYKKKFLCQLVKSQLDVDRLDYLARDSYYTGVVEGNVGYDRILNMIHVKNNHIVVEEKASNSIENFLLARYFMYQQVYLHKTSVTIEEMLSKAMGRIRTEVQRNPKHTWGESPIFDLWASQTTTNKIPTQDQLSLFSQIDDNDVWQLIKRGKNAQDPVTALLCSGILNRRLFHVTEKPTPIPTDLVQKEKKRIQNQLHITQDKDLDDLVFQKKISIYIYKDDQQPICVLHKDQSVSPLQAISDNILGRKTKKNILKHYFCYYK